MKHKFRLIVWKVKWWLEFWPNQIFPRVICNVHPINPNDPKSHYEILVYKMWMGRPRWEYRYEVIRPLDSRDGSRSGGMTRSRNICIP